MHICELKTDYTEERTANLKRHTTSFLSKKIEQVYLTDKEYDTVVSREDGFKGKKAWLEL